MDVENVYATKNPRTHGDDDVGSHYDDYLITLLHAAIMSGMMTMVDKVARYGIHLIAVHRKGASIGDIMDDFQLQFGDVLLVKGIAAQIKRFCEDDDLFAFSYTLQKHPRVEVWSTYPEPERVQCWNKK